ncbi:MAG: YjfB family protein [Firmicutes bacterium]|jgi:hypothetical protein|nr:YjfB family protein [Bacillota bacterium]
MNISNQMKVNLASLKQAIGTSVLQKSMGKDQQSMDMLKKMMEKSVSPHLGSSVDLKL